MTGLLSTLVQQICRVLGVDKINTSGYHPQTDGLVEKFNATLICMIAKSTPDGAEWDTRLPYVLFAYRATMQESTKESPFFLLYGRDPLIPMSTVLTYQRSPYTIDINDYKSEQMTYPGQAWKLRISKSHRATRKCSMSRKLVMYL